MVVGCLIGMGVAVVCVECDSTVVTTCDWYIMIAAMCGCSCVALIALVRIGVCSCTACLLHLQHTGSHSM
jgi:hypothetical protein